MTSKQGSMWIYVHADGLTKTSISELVESRGGKLIEIHDSVPIQLFSNDFPILWVIDKAESQELKDFLYHLKDSRRRHVILGNGADVLSEAAALWPKKAPPSSVVPLEGNSASPHPQHKRLASIIFSGSPSDRLDNILGICGYDTTHDSIPMDKSRIEQATMVVLVATKPMHDKYKKVQTILKGSLKKDVVLLLEEEHCEDMLTQILAQRGELPGWGTGTSANILDNPKLCELMDVYVEYLANVADLEAELIEHKTKYEGTPIAPHLQALSLWLQKSSSHAIEPKAFSPWAQPTDLSTVEETETALSLGSAFSQCLESMLASRRDIVSQCEVLLRASGLLTRWGPLQEQALPLFRYLVFRQSFMRVIQRAQKKHVTVVPKQVDDKKSGWFISKEERERFNTESKHTQEAEVLLKSVVRLCEIERTQITKVLIDTYWNLYAQTLAMWPESRMSPHAAVYRSFLRTGYVGSEFLDVTPIQIELIEKISSAPSGAWNYSAHERHVIFTDELADAIFLGLTGTGLDEDLELNAKGSEEWKASRKFRQRATIRRFQGICKSKADQLASAVADVESKLSLLDQGGTEKGGKNIDPALRELRVLRTRLQEHLQATTKLSTSVPMAALSAQGCEREFTSDFVRSWLVREVQLLRRYAMLCSEMKEHFIPDVIQRELTQDPLKLGTPASVISSLALLEELDSTLFDVTLAGARKADNRLTTTCSPTVIVLPGAGQLAFVAEGLDELTEGKIFIPLISQNPRGLMGLLVQAASDYRWDSSMSEAGPEWVSTDSLVGAYSRSRWDYRKMEKDSREKAQVYKEESDKKNFRRHYQLYVTSAKEQGRLLFYKSKALYAALNKYIPLPHGIGKMET